MKVLILGLFRQDIFDYGIDVFASFFAYVLCVFFARAVLSFVSDALWRDCSHRYDFTASFFYIGDGKVFGGDASLFERAYFLNLLEI